MAWSTAKGFNFRSTTLFKADGTNQGAVISSPEGTSNDSIQYPTSSTIGGESVTYGWTPTVCSTRDRDATPNVRFVGIHALASVTKNDFRVDLGVAGTYDISLALGDYSNAHANMQVEILDNTTSKFTVSGSTTTTDRFLTATSADGELSSSAWPGSNTAKRVTFATTTFILRLGDGVNATSCIAHLNIAPVASATAAPVVGGLLG